VRVILDRTSKTYNVWINEELRGQNLKIKMEHPEFIDAIALTSAWPGAEVYYDDVKVFEVHPVIPQITVITPGQVAINRPFDIRVEICNPSDRSEEYRAAIYETVYLGAIEVRAFGDREKSVTIPRGERGSVELKAVIDAPTPLTSFPITLVKVYRGGELVYEHKARIDAIADYTSIGVVVCQPFAERGKCFNVLVLGEYFFTRETKLSISIVDEDGRVVAQADKVVSGAGSIDERLTVGPEHTSKSGVKKFTVMVRAYAPEIGYRELPIRLPKAKTSESFIIEIGDYSSNNPPSGLCVTPYRFRIAYGGKEYIAVRFENLREEGYWWRDPDSLFKRFNWIVFGPNYEVVMDDELHKELALMAEAAYMRLGSWHETSLQNTIRLYEETAKWFEAAETILAIGKKLAEVGHTLLVTAATDGLAPKILAAEETTFEPSLMTSYVLKLKIHEIISEYAGLDPDHALACFATDSLRLSAKELKDANAILPPAEKIISDSKVDGESALKFYEKVKVALGRGEGAYDFVRTRLSDQKPYKVFWDLYGTMLLGKAKATVEEIAEFFTKTYKDIVRENPITILFSKMYYYDMKEKYLKEHSLDFRNAFLRDVSNSMKVTLTEVKGQHKLHLRIYDAQGRVVGYVRDLDAVKVEIPGSHYVDLGDGVLVVMPINASIVRIEVDASKAVEPVGSYNLTISRVRNGTAVSSCAYSGSIERGSASEFNVEVKGEKVEVKPTTKGIVMPIEVALVPVILAIVIATALLVKKKSIARRFYPTACYRGR